MPGARRQGISTAFATRPRHVVWATKYRYKVLTGDIRERARKIIRQSCDELGVTIVKGVLARDHVHMFLSVPPKHAISDVM
jgi:putative transposase